jgi:hypothetical protein
MAGFFSSLFGGAEEEAAAKNRAVSQQYGTDAQGYLKTGYDTGVTNLGKAVDAYTPLSELGTKYNMGGDLWRDSLGINGAAGNTRATGAFQNNPGYTGAVDAGLTGINRRRALSGMVDSGNADVDALTFSQNLQNQQYQNWQNQLQQSGNTGVGLVGAAAQGQAGGYGSLANLAQQYASGQSNVAGNVATGITNANNLQAQGEASGAKNILNAGLSIAGMFAGGPIGAGLGSSLSGMMGGGGGGITYGGPSGPTAFYKPV